MKSGHNRAASGSGFVLVLFTDPDCNCARFRADIKTDAASGAAGTAIGDREITLAVQGFALRQDACRTCRNAKGAPLTKMNGNLNIATVRVAHSTLPLNRLAKLCQKRIKTVMLFLSFGVGGRGRNRGRDSISVVHSQSGLNDSTPIPIPTPIYWGIEIRSDC